jgi:hypothetical protein
MDRQSAMELELQKKRVEDEMACEKCAKWRES